MTEDPFGRGEEEETDAFGRPKRTEGSLWSGGDPASDEAGAHEAPPAPGGWLPPAPPVPPAPATETPPSGFRPPTDSPPDASAWWTGAHAGTIEERAHGASLPGGVQPAEWLQRAGAAIVDLLVRLGLALLIVGAFALLYLAGDDAGTTGITIGTLLALVATWAYAPVMLARRNGQTVGHRVAGTRVVLASGAPISGGSAVVREVLAKGLLFDTLLLWFSLGIVTLLNYLWPLWDAKNEALHDKMCSTRVVKA